MGRGGREREEEGRGHASGGLGDASPWNPRGRSADTGRDDAETASPLPGSADVAIAEAAKLRQKARTMGKKLSSLGASPIAGRGEFAASAESARCNGGLGGMHSPDGVWGGAPIAGMLAGVPSVKIP